MDDPVTAYTRVRLLCELEGRTPGDFTPTRLAAGTQAIVLMARVDGSLKLGVFREGERGTPIAFVDAQAEDVEVREPGS